jgi:Ca2+-binding RTX toxin-like protein
MASVTIPGTGGSTVTIPQTALFSQFVAQQIANALAAASSVAVTGIGSGDIIPPTTPGSTNELMVTGAGGANSVPAGYDFIINDTSSPDSLSGSNTAILSGTVGGTFWVSGGSTVAAGGGNNTIVGQAGGTYLLSGGSGNDSIFSSGGGTIGGGTGNNLLWAADPTDKSANLFISDGTDTIAAGAGADTVVAYGSKDVIFGGSGTLLVGAATNSTISAGTGAETIFGASGDVVFGNNSSGILFVGGSGPATVLGSTSSITTIFGGSGSNITFQNVSTPGAIMAAYAGNETLNAAASTSNNTLAGGSGADSLVSGSGADVFWAGTGSDTMTGGAGADAFNFVRSFAGGTDVITDFTSSDTVNLIGYGAAAAATAIANATVSGGSSTIQLADSTKITFVNVSSLSTTNIHSA